MLNLQYSGVVQSFLLVFFAFVAFPRFHTNIWFGKCIKHAYKKNAIWPVVQKTLAATSSFLGCICVVRQWFTRYLLQRWFDRDIVAHLTKKFGSDVEEFIVSKWYEYLFNVEINTPFTFGRQRLNSQPSDAQQIPEALLV